MEVVRTVQTVTNGRISLDLPSEFSGKEVEIIVLTRDAAKSTRKSLRGTLQQYARPELTPQESRAWADAVEDKYGDR